jgi:hypothetical protein
MTKKEEGELKKLIPPKLYGKDDYVYSIKHCPGCGTCFETPDV